LTDKNIIFCFPIHTEIIHQKKAMKDLKRKVRDQQNKIEWMRAKLIRAEQSGFTDMSRNEILAQSKEEL